MAWRVVPAHVHESTEPVDNLGGIFSVVLVASLVLSINFAPVPGKGTLVLGLAVVAVAAAAAFYWQQRRAANPLYDLDVAGRRIFWVAACAGIIVFGSLMGAMFVSQQFLQNVLGYNTVEAGAAFLPAIFLMVLVAPRSAVARRDPRCPGDPAPGVRVPVPRLPVDAAVLGGGQQLLEDRHGLRPDRHRRRASRARQPPTR